MDDKDIANRFMFHPANRPETADAHAGVRTNCKQLADLLNKMLPEGREKALAITHLEETMMWANAAIARTPGD